MADQIIPVSSAPNQKLSVTLNVNGTLLTLQLALSFSEMSGYWLLRISDASGNIVLDSLPLVTGEWPGANILSPYEYLQIGSLYVINASGIKQDYPGASNMGSDFKLLWSDN